MSLSIPMSPPPLPFLPLPAAGISPPLTTATQSQAHPSSSPLENLKPSILIIILILSITLLVSLSLCLLLRLLNRRCLHPLSSSSSSASSSTASSNRSRVSPQITDSSLLDSLPLFTFASIHRRSASASSSGDCAVCLSKFEPNDQLRLLPLCCHAFHSACIDTWLLSNQTCPLCRSPLHASDSDILKALSGSFRLEIGSVSRRQGEDVRRGGSYSMGSFDYVVEEEEELEVVTEVQSAGDRRSVSENKEDELAAEVGRSSWLKDCVDRLSSSFRSSGRFLSSRRSGEAAAVAEYDVEEANRYGEEISELFRWFSGV
ncbi:unnamed protein product [Linum trigynum]|uniref:RING-type E3 ubiquitin transferase n=1 Tax=Linum trigynum TaxID=586398 RepID=A0AAV2ESD5_9ROSI